VITMTDPNVSSQPSQRFIPRFRGAFVLGARQALQWRLLLLWVLAVTLSAAVTLLPLGLALGGLLDRSPLAAKLVDGFDVPLLVEVVSSLGPRGWSPASGLGGLIAFALLLPWLSGVAMAAARAAEPPRMVELLRGGIGEYPRMARLGLWALLPLGLAGAAGGGLMHVVSEQTRTMTLESDALWLGRAGLALTALLLLLAHATVDAARAQLVIEPRLRSVVRAWWRATRGLARRPGNVLLYAAVSASGLLLAALLGLVRLQVAPVTTPNFMAALLLGAAVVATLAWMRCARLFALVAAGRR
jgi:hypothetical protein